MPLPGPAAEHVAPLSLIGPQRVAVGQQNAPILERFHADGWFRRICSANWRGSHIPSDRSDHPSLGFPAVGCFVQ